MEGYLNIKADEAKHREIEWSCPVNILIISCTFSKLSECTVNTAKTSSM